MPSRNLLKRLVAPGLVLLAALALAPDAIANEAGVESAPSPRDVAIPEFTAKSLDSLGLVPVQNEGRVKPLASYAAFTMLELHHKRTFTLADGRRIKPTEWWLRTVLFPDRAVDDKIFRIEDSDVLDQVGLGDIKRKKRDLYSFNELREGYRRMREKYSEYARIDSRKQTRDQKMLVTLAHKVFTFEDMLGTFTYAEFGVPLRSPAAKEAFGGRDAVPLSEALTKLHEAIQPGMQPEEWVRDVAQTAMELGRATSTLRLMAPLDAEDGLRADWYSVADIVDSVLGQDPAAKANIEFLAKLEAVYAARGSAAGLEKAADALLTDARARAESSNAYGKIEMEVSYYKLDLFSRALYVFLIGFVALAASWLWPRNRWINRALWSFAILGAVLVTWGIVLRCILRGRPPVSTLYETIIFITGVAVISSLAIEWMNKRRIGIAAAIALGALGLFIAARYEEIDRKDTMPQLQAVLDTNFWLATHVTCITMGYAAGLLAAAIAHVYVIGKAFRFKKDDPDFYRGVSRMVYGALGFSLIFSVVGTILGGVWANDSWGRFWGWDPKENGALMIVLSQLAIIHGRLGGYLKAFGVSVAVIAGGMVIAFSWWGVNLLGIGLHAYGFTEGLQRALNIFYLTESLVLVFAGSVWLYDKYAAPRAAA